MPVYLCRWPNGDVSIAAGESDVELADVLDEVDNPDAAELIQLDQAVAVHFTLGQKPGDNGAVPLEFVFVYRLTVRAGQRFDGQRIAQLLPHVAA
jgi:hypothetical protein